MVEKNMEMRKIITAYHYNRIPDAEVRCQAWRLEEQHHFADWSLADVSAVIEHCKTPVNEDVWTRNPEVTPSPLQAVVQKFPERVRE